MEKSNPRAEGQEELVIFLTLTLCILQSPWDPSWRRSKGSWGPGVGAAKPCSAVWGEKSLLKVNLVHLPTGSKANPLTPTATGCW